MQFWRFIIFDSVGFWSVKVDRVIANIVFRANPSICLSDDEPPSTCQQEPAVSGVNINIASSLQLVSTAASEIVKSILITSKCCHYYIVRKRLKHHKLFPKYSQLYDVRIRTCYVTIWRHTVRQTGFCWHSTCKKLASDCRSCCILRCFSCWITPVSCSPENDEAFWDVELFYIFLIKMALKIWKMFIYACNFSRPR